MKSFYGFLLFVYVINTAMTGSSVSGKESSFVQPDTPVVETQERLVSGPDSRNFNGEEGVTQLVQFALSHLNKPYAYAGKGPDTFDCSGFTGYVFRHFELQLPASSQLQSRVGILVERDQLRPGDLVFFKNPSEGVNRIGHVGMITRVSEEGIEFIHSSTRRGVTIDDLHKSAYYSARFMMARRVF